ncbi:signal peptidase II [Hyphomonas sp.]|jgi:signal peptidase II|uniref:signal peptidase II n=1 Tax=Hyphomonas sp. TaxID=87 RepID=UPI0025C49D7B|nr:signal peptidase II [Hyphomonas sp.]
MKLPSPSAWPFFLVPVVVLLDQWSKWLVLQEPRFNALGCLDRMEPCGRIPLPGPLDFTMLWNRGMSYGLFQTDGIGRWILAAIMATIAIGFFVWLLKAEGRWLRLALALVIGGAFGNLIDRVRFGAVVDFIDANGLYFPWVFNVADAAISVGAVLLFIDQFLLSRPKQATSS